MMMRQISEGIYGLLVSQGLANAKPVGAGRVRGIDAGERSDNAAHPAIGRRPGGQTGPIGNSGKGRGPKPAPVQHREKRHTCLERGTTVNRTDALRLIVNPNMTGMAMRQTTQTPRAFAPRGVVSLMVIDGGKA
jgi:hypothetical protein